MSFSSKVKEELSGHISNAQHCRIAEIAAIISMCGSVAINVDEKYSIIVRTETEPTANKYKMLLWKTFHIDADIVVRTNAYSKNLQTYTITVKDHEEAMKVLQATKLIDDRGEIGENLSIKNNVIIMKDCCKRAFIRGAFMAAGSVNDPNKSYHFEIKCNNNKKSEQLINLLDNFNIDAKMVARKGNFVVYIKEGEGVVDVLNVMEAPVALMEMENIRILKGMSNYYNRQVNCETANIKKTVTTACRQIEDINYIIEHKGIGYLPEKLQDIATVRVENPDISLQELGQLLTPPLGKSGVNHRLRKICQIADELRG
ncbi:MAG: DNA-binding protein WhiA [Eubacterium sp.]